MRMEEHKFLRPDAKGRIALGKLAQGVSGYHVTVDAKNRIVLEPYTEIPLREKWLFENKAALQSVLRGIKQSGQKKGKYLGDFSQYLDNTDA